MGFLPEQRASKGGERKETISQRGQSAEDAESRKRKVKRHKGLRSCGRREDIGVS